MSNQPKRIQLLTIVAEISDGKQIHNLSEYFNLDEPHPDLTVLHFSCEDSRWPDNWKDIAAND